MATLGTRTARAQGALTNGAGQGGSITAADQMDSWTTVANQGDRVTVQVAKLTGGVTFKPTVQVFAPDGTPLGSSSGAVAARVDVQAPVSGTFTVTVSDATQTGTGTYQLQLAQVPGVFTVPAGDDGGALTNGANAQSTIAVGDLDLWSFTANSGDRIALLVAKLSGGVTFKPQIELFAPDGTRLGVNSDTVAARLDVQAEVSGTYTVLVSAQSPDATGGYQLQLAQVPESFVVPAGDEGGALADGVDQDGTIALGDFDLWTFTASPGDHVTLQITAMSGGVTFKPMIELFGSNGEGKASAQGATGATIDTAIETAGTYTLLVSDAIPSGSGTYRLHLTRGTIAPAGPNVLVNGETETGSIAAAGTTNFWTFTASVGDSLVVRIGELANTAFYPWVRLLNPAGTSIGSASGANAAEIAVTATNSGTFTVIVSDGSNAHNQTGDYRLTLGKAGSPIVVATGDEGGPMTNGWMHTGTITTGDLDVWSFTAQAGESLVVRVGDSTATANLYPWIRLYGPDGTGLAGASGANAAEVTARATNSGTFTVIVGDGYNGLGGTGDYRLTLGKTGSPIVISSGEEGGPMTNGWTHTGTIETGTLDVWSFTAQAGESLVVRVGDFTGTANLYPWIRLYGPDGARLDGASGAMAAEVAVRATNSGTFTIIIGDGNNGIGGTGDYRLTLAKTGSPIVISSGEEGGPMTNGWTHTGTIETGTLDVWSFSAQAGQRVVVRVGDYTGTANLYPWIRLYGPDGAALGQGSGSVAGEVTTLTTNSGTFTVIVGDGNNGLGGTGDYRLTLGMTGSPIAISPGDEGGSMTNGWTHTGTITTGDLDVWRFTAQAGDGLVVRAGDFTGTGNLAPWVRLYGPDGAALGEGVGAVAGEVALRATNSGTFTVVVADGNNGFGGAGDYRLTLAKTGSPILISPGDEGGPMTGVGAYNGMIDVGGLAAWSFTACAGDVISINAARLVSGSSLAPWVRLYGRDGVLLKSVVNAPTAGFVIAAPADGSYLVVVGDGNNGLGGTGTYQLTVNGLSDALKVCLPGITGAKLNVTGVGGRPGATFVLLTTTNVATPANLWTPILTNQFDQFGVFNSTNSYSPTVPQQFFRLSVR